MRDSLKKFIQLELCVWIGWFLREVWVKADELFEGDFATSSESWDGGNRFFEWTADLEEEEEEGRGGGGEEGGEGGLSFKEDGVRFLSSCIFFSWQIFRKIFLFFQPK